MYITLLVVEVIVFKNLELKLTKWKLDKGSGEMAKSLRALTALAKTYVQFPEPTWQLTIFLIPSWKF